MPASLAASARGKPSSAPAIACRRAAAARSFRRQVRADCQRPSTHLRPPPTGLDATRITSARVDSNHLRVRKFAGRYNLPPPPPPPPLPLPPPSDDGSLGSSVSYLLPNGRCLPAERGAARGLLFLF